MPRSAKDIQLIELKDTIAELNELIMTQTRSMDSLQKTVEGLRQELSNKQAEVDYLKAKLFGSSSEKRKSPFPGQMGLFEEMPCLWNADGSHRNRDCPHRASPIAINCLNMNGVAVKKDSLTNRYTAVVSRIRNLSLRLSWRGLISRRLLAEAVLPEP